MGYGGESKNCRLYDSNTRIHVSSDVIFNKNSNGVGKEEDLPVNTLSLNNEDGHQNRQGETPPENEDTDFISSKNEKDTPRLREIYEVNQHNLTTMHCSPSLFP